MFLYFLILNSTLEYSVSISKNKNALAGAALSVLILSKYGNVHSGGLLIFQAAPRAAGACVSIPGPLLCQPCSL